MVWEGIENTEGDDGGKLGKEEEKRQKSKAV